MNAQVDTKAVERSFILSAGRGISECSARLDKTIDMMDTYDPVTIAKLRKDARSNFERTHDQRQELLIRIATAPFSSGESRAKELVVLLGAANALADELFHSEGQDKRDRLVEAAQEILRRALEAAEERAGASLIELGVGCLAPATPSADVV